jgi:hypothetical protein
VRTADYDLQFDRRHRVLRVAMGRAVTKATVLDAYAAVQRFLLSEGPCSVIADLSGIECERIPGDFVRSVASMPSAIPAENWLILIAPQAGIYGLSRMFHLWRDERANYRIVRTLEEGYMALALDAPEFQPVDGALSYRAASLTAPVNITGGH